MASFLLILRRDQFQPLGAPQEEMFGRFRDWTMALHASGALRGVERLKPASEGMTLRASDGAVAATGRYDGAREDVIGYYLIEAESASAARTMAEACPILGVGGSVELRETEAFPKPAA